MAATVKSLEVDGRTYSIPTGLFINGDFVEAVSRGTFDVEDPATGKTVLSIAEGQPEDVDIAVRAARATFEGSWSESDPAWRASLMNRLADIMQENFDEILAIEMLDSGKTYKQASSIDVPASIGTLRYMAGWADKVYGRTAATVPGAFSYTLREPIGVCGQIIPWKSVSDPELHVERIKEGVANK